MKSSYPWMVALEVSPEQFSKWQFDAPKGLPLIYWATLNNQIDSAKYLSWAKEYYSLPVLKEEFFKTHDITSFWHKVSSVANWSEHLIPLLEWDGVVYIACVEPPADINWSFRTQYILSSASSLKNFWNQIHSSTEANTSSEQPQRLRKPKSAPVRTIKIDQELSDSDNIVASVSPQQYVDAIPEKYEDVAPVQSPTPTPPAKPAPINKQPLALEDVSTALELPEAPAPQNVEIPEGLEFFASQTQKSQTASAYKPAASGPEGLNFNFSKLAIKDESIIADSPTPERDASEPVVPEPDFHDLSVIFEEKAVHTNIKFPPVPRPQTEFDSILLEAKKYFKASMLLKIQNNEFIPVTWDEGFTPSSDGATSAWELNTPSAFRVAYQSKQPYLGRIVPTELNKEFFSNWGFNDLPESILVQPIKVKNHISYLILVLCDATKKNHTLLYEGVQLTEKMIALLQQKDAA